jgi:adenylate kinase
MKVVVVTGTPGAGKTTVLKGVLKKIKGFDVVNYGDEMFKVARDEKIVAHRDEIRKLHPNLQRKIQKAAAKRIAEKSKIKPIIVDTHCSIKTRKGYLPGLPKWVIQDLSPGMIILIEAEPSEIMERRKKDVGRKRDEEYFSEIEEHQALNRAVAMAYAFYSGATVKIIKNRNGKLDDAIKEMETLLEKCSSQYI